jgi:hypothetical protein
MSGGCNGAHSNGRHRCEGAAFDSRLARILVCAGEPRHPNEVEPDAENRSMEVIADSATFYRSSRITLEGDCAPKTMMVEFRRVPPGDYEVSDAHRGGRTSTSDSARAGQRGRAGPCAMIFIAT